MTAEPFCFIDLDKNAIGQQIEGECEGDCGIQDFDVDLLEHLIVDDSQDEQDENSQVGERGNPAGHKRSLYRSS